MSVSRRTVGKRPMPPFPTGRPSYRRQKGWHAYKPLTNAQQAARRDAWALIGGMIGWIVFCGAMIVAWDIGSWWR